MQDEYGRRKFTAPVSEPAPEKKEAPQEDRDTLLTKKDFFCAACQVQLKDSTGWLDHINSKQHAKATGGSMVVQRVSLEQVRAKLAQRRKRKTPLFPEEHPVEKRRRVSE